MRFPILLLLLCLLSGACFAQTPAPAPGASADGVHSLPHGPAYSLPADKLRRAETLDRDENWLWAIGTLWAVISLLLVLGLRWAARFSRLAARITKRPWVQGLIFIPLVVILLRLLDLPLALAGHHIGLAYGLSIERWPAWLWDWTKGLFVTLVISTIVGSLLFAIVRHAPRRWWLWFWLLSLPLMVAGVFIQPLIIDPLFNHFEPLSRSHPELVTQLESVVKRSGESIPRDHMFLMKASEKTTQLNAYVTGFGSSKRVVVWDTSLQKSSSDEVLFIFGHELGHYVLGDVVNGLLMSAAAALLGLWVAFHLTRRLLCHYGERWQIAGEDDWSTLIVLALVFTVLTIVSAPVANAVSRHIEHRADVYGQEVIHGIVADPQATAVHSFQTLGEESLDTPYPNPAMVFWTYDHPPIPARANFARDYDPWKPGGRPRFFAK